MKKLFMSMMVVFLVSSLFYSVASAECCTGSTHPDPLAIEEQE